MASDGINSPTAKAFGIRKTGGPAPYGMPLIPFVVNGDMIEATDEYKDWYTFCA